MINMLTVVDEVDSIDWLNAQWFDSDYQELEIDHDFSQELIIEKELITDC